MSAGLAVLLAACSAPAPDGFRDLQAPFGVTTRFDAVAFSGAWRVVESFAPLPPATITVVLIPEAEQLRLFSKEIPEIEGLYRQGVPGEWIPDPAGREKLVVMWVDEDFETAVIGTPSGRFGAVLDRDGAVPDDVARAARDILEFYGWDTRQLKETI